MQSSADQPTYIKNQPTYISPTAAPPDLGFGKGDENRKKETRPRARECGCGGGEQGCNHLTAQKHHVLLLLSMETPAEGKEVSVVCTSLSLILGHWKGTRRALAVCQLCGRPVCQLMWPEENTPPFSVPLRV